MAEEKFLSDFPQCFPFSVYSLKIEQSTCEILGMISTYKWIWSYTGPIDVHEKIHFFPGKK